MWSALGLVEERLGIWLIRWRPEGFSIQKKAEDLQYDFFRFSKIILPLQIKTVGDYDRLFLRLDPAGRLEILRGTPRADLERFKQRLSMEVLAASHSPFGCEDCRSDANGPPTMWDGTVCPGCREYYCRNPRCLRRLQLVRLNEGALVCKCCGVENHHGTWAADVETPRRADLPASP